MLVQKIHKTYGTQLGVVMKYYGLLNVLNSLSLSYRDLLILAYANQRPFTQETREEFCQIFDVPLPSLQNYIHKLVKRGFLQKKGKIVSLAPQLHIDANALLLQIHIEQEQTQTQTERNEE